MIYYWFTYVNSTGTVALAKKTKDVQIVKVMKYSPIPFRQKAQTVLSAETGGFGGAVNAHSKPVAAATTSSIEGDYGRPTVDGKSLLIYICNSHVLSNLLLIYIYKLHWNRRRLWKESAINFSSNTITFNRWSYMGSYSKGRTVSKLHQTKKGLPTSHRPEDILTVFISGVYICKSIVNYLRLRHGNYICKSQKEFTFYLH